MLPPLELLASLKSQRAVQLLAARLQSVQLLGFQLLGVQLWASSCGRAAARRAADGGGQSHRARILAHTFAAAHPKPFERTLPAAATAARSATEAVGREGIILGDGGQTVRCRLQSFDAAARPIVKRLLGKWRACAIERGPAQASQMTSCEGREVQFTVSSPPRKQINSHASCSRVCAARCGKLITKLPCLCGVINSFQHP